MVEIIPERRRPSTAEKFSSAVGTGLDQGNKLYQQQQEDTALKEMGLGHLAGLSPELKKLALAEELKGRRSKKEADTQKFTTGLDVIQQMRSILDKGNVGRGSAFMGFFPGETQRERAELEQLGKSLIPLVAAGVPIRNQREFDEYKKIIIDPSSPIDRMKGALDGLERIFQGKLQSEEKQEKPGKMKFNPNNPEHKAKAEQLHKTFKDKEKVREMLKREFEGL